ncbi:AmmeMemoRadiSam system protein B [Sunxiuqinia sp. sy24]|uniref:AmmeMemoRadiSam system protein B n=1 Tax=Sunxiuqinia sp. sy24 TaxID=3461495 RepID=UPI0040459E85
MNTSIRNPIFTGSFYPDSEVALKRLIQEVYQAEKETINNELAKRTLIGGIVPHAGYAYSGYEAIHFYDILKQSQQHFDTIVVVNPNHTGYGSGWFNTSTYAEWKTPLGLVNADLAFVDALDIEPNNRAHSLEHSGEVQLPFLQLYAEGPFAVAMITMNKQTVASAVSLASKIRQAAVQTGQRILLIASSDFSHHESPSMGYEKDQLVIDQILSMNSQKVFDAVQQHKVSACGYGPIMALIEYTSQVARRPGIALLRRGNSGEVQPAEMVVDYISFLCYDA